MSQEFDDELDSVEKRLEDAAEAPWEVEIARRVQELDSETAQPLAWSRARRIILGH